MQTARRFWTRTRREEVAGWLFVAPETIGMLLVFAFPLMFSLFLSFAEWDLVGGLSSVRFVGLDNFQELWTDDKFHRALRNNLLFTAGTVPVAIALALVLAVLVQEKLYWKSYFKIAFFIPYICSTVAVAAVWSALFHPTLGPINRWLENAGFRNPPLWLVDTTYAIVAVMIIAVWQTVGYYVVVYIAGLTNIPAELYEAASIDGATGWSKFLHITLPLLGPTTLFLSITGVISSFKVFDLIKFLTGGGPDYASTVIVYQIYEEGFQKFHMGYAAAMSWVLFVLIVLVTAASWKLQNTGQEARS